MNRHRKNASMAMKQRNVKNALLVFEREGNQAWLSTNELANALGMARNGRFKAMLDVMVEQGQLQRRECERAGRWPGYEYSLSDHVKSFYARPLKINHRKNGKQVQSLELWS